MLTKQERDAWADALESGKYKQCKGIMHDEFNNTYCCIGVFCSLNIPPSIKYRSDSYSYFANKVGRIENEAGDLYFIHLNDRLNKTFPEIAQIVRQLPTCD